jgi:excisionase family DNA binding protein
VSTQRAYYQHSLRTAAVDPELLTIGQAAKFLKIRPATVKRWLAQGFPTVRLGPRSVRLRRSALLAMLTSGLPNQAPPPPAVPVGWRVLRGGRG